MTLPESFGKIVDKFIELHGDRIHGDTEQIRCGLGWIGEQRLVIILHNHRRSNDLSIGYRKSLRMLRLGEQLKKPVLWWVENIKDNVFISLDLLNNINKNIKSILNLKVPIIGVFSSTISKSAIISPNILDHAVILSEAENDDENSEISVDAKNITVAGLSSLRAHLVDMVDKLALQD